MNKLKHQLLAFFLVLAMCFGQFQVILADGLVDQGTNEATGKVIVSVEKFTLGQGYYTEPIEIPFEEGEMVGSSVAKVLGSGNYNHGKDSDNISYLANIYDPSSEPVNVPQYILNTLEKYDKLGTNKDDWLGEFDYSMFSGWMYTVNNQLPDKGMAQYPCVDGDVIRLQFTIYGYGADLGFSGWGGPALANVANKDALTKLIVVKIKRLYFKQSFRKKMQQYKIIMIRPLLH